MKSVKLICYYLIIQEVRVTIKSYIVEGRGASWKPNIVKIELLKFSYFAFYRQFD